MNDKVKTITKGDKVIYISYDENAESPREWDNLGVMALFHNRYNMPNEAGINSSDFDNWEEMRHELEKQGAINILPVFMYDHSGVSLSTTPYDDRWDSGQVGYIYTTREKIKLMGTPKNRIKAALEGEIDIYNKYMEGEIYGFEIYQKCPTCGNDGNFIDSCWGYYSVEEAEAEALNNL